MTSYLSTSDFGSCFREDSPRPPVPGGSSEENHAPTAMEKAWNQAALLSTSLDTALECGIQSKFQLETFDANHNGAAVRRFEPDGSTGNVTKFSEVSRSCSPHATSLLSLLDNSNSVSYFRQFLRTRQKSDALDFWLTCTGFHKVDESKCHTVAVAIYKKFIARSDSQLGLSSGVRQSIKECLVKDRNKSASVSHSVFDGALAEVESNLRCNFYPLFLESEEYAEYVRIHSLNSSPSDSRNSGLSSCKESPVTERVKREFVCQERQEDDSNFNSVEQTTKTTTTMLLSTQPCSRQHVDVETDGTGSCCESVWTGVRSVSPSAVRAPAGSILDTEIHSLSSDPLTDADNFSLTDLSVDSRDNPRHHCLSRSLKNHAPQPCVKCAQTKCHAPPTTCRTQQPAAAAHGHGSSTRNGNIAEKNPQQFACLLTEALNQIRSSRYESHDPSVGRYEHHGCCRPDNSGEGINVKELFRDGASGVSGRRTSISSSSAESKMVALLVEAASEREESAQSILERHMSLVFDSPDNNQTPTDCRFPECIGRRNSKHRVNVPRTVHSDTAGPVRSLATQSSGRVNPLPAAMTTGPTAHVQTHFESFGTGAAAVGLNGQHCGPETTTAGHHQATEHGNTAAHHLPAVGNTGLTSIHHRQTSTCVHAGANEKVMKWMLVNEQLQPPTMNSSDTTTNNVSAFKPTSTHRSAMHFRQRSVPLSSSSGVILPAQPIIQDPSMPLLTPPDPTTQLEEARRRLQLETTTRVPPKSILCSSSYGHNVSNGGFVAPPGVSSDRVMMSSMYAGQRASVTAKQQQHHVVDGNGTNTVLSGLLPHSCSKASDKLPASLPVAPVSSSTITVVYFLCDEPIPYSSKVHAQHITLAQFKEIVAKRGTYRYYFKQACNDFNSGFVYEETTDDDTVLPLIDGKICAKVVRVI